MEGELALVLIFGLPIIAILTAHHRKVLELRIKARSAPDKQVMARLDALSKEVADLRATATEYDLSFDAALQRLESRVERLETQRMTADSARVQVSTDH